MSKHLIEYNSVAKTTDDNLEHWKLNSVTHTQEINFDFVRI